jgi:tyrosinase
MVDRVWWIWQMQNLESRLFEVQGYDRQARRDGTASDKVNLGVNGPSVEIGSLLDTMGGLNGELCYIYF